MLPRDDWNRAVRFHGHSCPGLAIGFKAAEGAVAELELTGEAWPSPDEEIVCVTENDACGVDAIQCLLSCTYGKGNLIPRLRGKMAFSFFLRNRSGSAAAGAQAAAAADSHAATPAVRLLYTGKSPEGASREEYIEHILNTPYSELFSSSAPDYGLPESARMFNSQNCAFCGESTAEYGLRVQASKLVCIDCYSAYEREGFGA
jgi:formylmethanofuran dehydrogenase subunit E